MSQHTPHMECDCVVGEPTSTRSHDVGCPMRTLMAAAPELLEALQESCRWMSKVAADHDGDGTGLDVRALHAHTLASRAIRKATEGQS